MTNSMKQEQTSKRTIEIVLSVNYRGAQAASWLGLQLLPESYHRASGKVLNL